MEATARRVLAVAAALLAAIGAVLAAFVVDSDHASAGRFQPPPIPPGAVVFLGDSIVRQEPWERLLPGVRTSNQGIGGNRSADVLARLDTVIAARPHAVFLHIGSNDVRWDVPHGATVTRIGRILDRLAAETPATALHLGSILPRWPEHAERIRRLNDELESLAAARGIPWIDTHRHFHAGDGVLRPELTNDGSHLTPAGMALLADVVRPHVAAAVG